MTFGRSIGSKPYKIQLVAPRNFEREHTAEAENHYADSSCSTTSISSRNMILSQLMSLDSQFNELEIEQSNYKIVRAKQDSKDSNDEYKLSDSDDDHTELPPPKVFFKKNRLTETPKNRYSLTRAASCQTSPSKANLAKQLLKAKNMIRSMPNFQMDRSYYNRKVGSALDCVASSYGIQHAWHDRVMEFDALLESL